MKLKSLVLVTIVLGVQSHSALSVDFGRLDGFLQQNNIDFDALEEELSLLPATEEKEENSWWVTRQVKHYSTKLMIKALLAYIAVQEYCSDTWDSISRKIHNTKIRIKAILVYIAIRKYCNDTWNSFSAKVQRFQRSIMEKIKKQPDVCQNA